MVELSADEARPLLRAWPSEVPTGVGFMKRSGLIREGRPEEFEALAGICPVFRFEWSSTALSDNPFDSQAWRAVDGFGD